MAISGKLELKSFENQGKLSNRKKAKRREPDLLPFYFWPRMVCMGGRGENIKNRCSMWHLGLQWGWAFKRERENERMIRYLFGSAAARATKVHNGNGGLCVFVCSDRGKWWWVSKQSGLNRWIHSPREKPIDGKVKHYSLKSNFH